MKRMSWMLGAMVLGFATLTGCTAPGAAEEVTGTTSSRLTVQGSVSERLNTDNARAVAIGKDGKKIWTYLDKNGDFSLKLPAGKSYRVLIANQLPEGGQKVIGKLSLKNGGSKTEWLKAKAGGKVNLGKLVKPTADTSGTVAPKCFCDEDFAKDGEEKEPTKPGAGEEEEWGDDGWDDKGEWSEEFEDKEADSNHDDDNECFGDDEDFVKGEKGEKGKDGDDDLGGKKEIDEDEVCDVCTEGDIADLEPTKKGAGDWADVDAKGHEKPESKSCPKKQTKEESTDEDPTAPTKPAPAPQSKKPGDKCSVKNECGESICVASKCQVK